MVMSRVKRTTARDALMQMRAGKHREAQLTLKRNVGLAPMKSDTAPMKGMPKKKMIKPGVRRGTVLKTGASTLKRTSSMRKMGPSTKKPAGMIRY